MSIQERDATAGGNRLSLASIIQGCRLEDRNRQFERSGKDNADARSPNDNNVRPLQEKM